MDAKNAPEKRVSVWLRVVVRGEKLVLGGFSRLEYRHFGFFAGENQAVSSKSVRKTGDAQI
jgi:hypothetical protein